MKILNVILSMDEASGGGCTERALQLTKHWTRQGHAVTVLTTAIGMTPALVASLGGAQVVAVPYVLPRFPVPRPPWGPISRAVQQADVVHFINHWSVLSALAYRAVRRYRKPYVVSPLGSLLLFGRSHLVKRLYNAAVGTRLIRNANRFCVATLSELPAFREYGADESRVAHMPNGINEGDYVHRDDSDAFRRRIGVGSHPFILFMGRLNPIKGPDMLLDAFCRVKDTLPDMHMVMIGIDQGMLDSLKASASRQGVGARVHFLGFVSREDKSRVIHLSRLVVVPSRREAMSIVVLEAGIAGKPVLITDQCGFDEVATVGGGRVVPATVEGLAEGLTGLLEQSAALEAMGGRLREMTRGKYIWASVAQSYADLLRSVAEEHPPR